MAIAPWDSRFLRPGEAWPQGKQSRSSELNSECEQELQHQLEQAASSRGLLALLLVEVEQFKLVKNPRGSEVGNALLSAFFLALMKKVPAAAGVARFGEETFAVMLPGIDATVALRLARELKTELEDTCFGVGNPPQDVRLTIGVGVAVYPHDSDSALGLLGAAGLALAETKRGKGDRVALYFGAKTGKRPSRAEARPPKHAAVSRNEISPPVFAAGQEALNCSELDLISASLSVAPATSTPARLEGPLSVMEAALRDAPGPASAGEARRTMPADAALQLLDSVQREIGDSYAGTVKSRPANWQGEQRSGKPRAPQAARGGNQAELQLMCASLDAAAESSARPKAQPPLPATLQNEDFEPFPYTPARSSPPPPHQAVPAVKPTAGASVPATAAETRRPEPSKPASSGAPGVIQKQTPPAATVPAGNAASSFPPAVKPPEAPATEVMAYSGSRREQRLRAAFPVQISGMDGDGKMFEDATATIDVTTTGARLSGLTHQVQKGYILELKHRSHKARYVVKWVGTKGTADEGQVGVQLIDQGKLIWGRALPRVLGDQHTVRRREKPRKE
jgi:diguanylate cyclase (GGDEF)-like protein